MFKYQKLINIANWQPYIYHKVMIKLDIVSEKGFFVFYPQLSYS